MYTKLEVSNSTHYEDIKDDIKCRKWGIVGGHSRSLEIAPFGRAHYEFLLVFHGNYVLISQRFCDIARCWSKIDNLNLHPTSVWRLVELCGLG